MFDLLYEIYSANPNRDVKTISRRIIKLQEEIGEVSEAYLYSTTENNTKGKTWDDVREEAIDTVIIGLDIALTCFPLDDDKSPAEIEEEVIKVFERKLNRWRKQLSEKEDATQNEMATK